MCTQANTYRTDKTMQQEGKIKWERTVKCNTTTFDTLSEELPQKQMIKMIQYFEPTAT
jgi:hypothetical protein